MNRRIAYLIAAGLALCVAPRVATCAADVRQLPANVEVVLNGVPVQRYAYDGRWYVEALKGREYAIRLRNPYPVRVAVALSVDGLNTIDARQTTAADARKWVLDPYETVTISGWQTSSTEARRFVFTTEAQSYGRALGKTQNLGLISAVFFKERVRYKLDREESRDRQQAAPSASAVPKDQRADASNQKAEHEYAATGMGRPTDHAVTRVWLDLEDTPAHAVDIRYEFRPQLVRLGILPAPVAADPLQRRERAHGFEPGFCPEPKR
jgi:hypothetical protein